MKSTLRRTGEHRADLKQSVSIARRKADWRRVEELYRQFTLIINDPEKKNTLPDDIMGSLAESLARIFAHYDAQEREFLDDMFSIFSHIVMLPKNWTRG